MYCPIFKAAATTWLTNFRDLSSVDEKTKAGYAKKEKIIGVVRKLYPPFESLEAFNKQEEANEKVLIVRHPFYRLLSAYRDKFERISEGKNTKSDYFHVLYGKKIITKYRREAEEKFY